MDDLTTTGGVRNLLGAFWTRMASADLFVSGISEKTSATFRQLYQDLGEVINSVGIQTIAGYHTELVVPIVFGSTTGSSYGPPVFGDGSVYGPQVSGGPWTPGQILYHGTDADRNGALYLKFANTITGCSVIVTDSPANPSVILMRDVDFTIPPEGDGIYFRINPLEDPRITVRTNYDGTQEAVLWMFQVRTDDGSLELHHGYPFDTGALKGEALRSIISRIYSICSGGPTPNMIESFLAVAAGQPVTGAIETVESISAFGTSQVVVTDREAYVLPSGTSVARGVEVGAVLHAGKPLSSVVTLSDFRSCPEWWRSRPALVFPGNMIHPSFGLSHLCFPNKEVTMIAVEDPGGSGEYLLDPGVGTEDYRIKTLARQEADNVFTGSAVWNKMLGGIPGPILYASPQGPVYASPDATPYARDGIISTVALNALEVLMEVLGGRDICSITVDASGVADLTSFAALCSCLDDVTPLGSVMIIVVDTTISDVIDCSTTTDEASLSASLGVNSDHVAIGPLNEQILLTHHERIP